MACGHSAVQCREIRQFGLLNSALLSRRRPNKSLWCVGQTSHQRSLHGCNGHFPNGVEEDAIIVRSTRPGRTAIGKSTSIYHATFFGPAKMGGFQVTSQDIIMFQRLSRNGPRGNKPRSRIAQTPAQDSPHAWRMTAWPAGREWFCRPRLPNQDTAVSLAADIALRWPFVER